MICKQCDCSNEGTLYPCITVWSNKKRDHPPIVLPMFQFLTCPECAKRFAMIDFLTLNMKSQIEQGAKIAANKRVYWPSARMKWMNWMTVPPGYPGKSPYDRS